MTRPNPEATVNDISDATPVTDPQHPDRCACRDCVAAVKKTKKAKSTTLVVKNSLDAAQAAVDAAEKEVADFLQRHRDARYAEWLALGGCVRCGGTGYVHQRDQSGVLDWDPCSYLAPEGHVCTALTIGMPPGAHARNAYDANVTRPVAHDRDMLSRNIAPVAVDDPRNRYPAVPALLHDPADVVELQTLRENLDLARDMLRPLATMWRPVAGARFQAIRDFSTKGITISAGTEGVAVWAETTHVNERRYHGATTVTRTRVGFKPDGSHTAVFVDVDGRLHQIAPAPDAAHPSLTGSDKQVSWARRLRQAAIANGAVSDDVVQRETSAKFWIDNRARWGNDMGGVRL